MLGQVGRFHLTGADVPPTLVAKLPADHRANRGQGEFLGLYEREIQFYRELAPHVDYRIPQFLGAAMAADQAPGPAPDPELGKKLARLPGWLLGGLVRLGMRLAGWVRRPAVLLLEDLAPAAPGDQLTALDDGALDALLRAVAHAHAGSWNAPILLQQTWLPSVDTAPSVPQAIYRIARRRLLRGWGDRLPGALVALADRANARSHELAAALAGPPWTLLHGDLRLDNLFFAGPTASDVIFTDWQVPSRGRAVNDLAYLMSGTLGPQVSADEEDGWVSGYHGELEKAGVSGYALETCLADYRLASLYILPRVLAVFATVDFTNRRGFELQAHWLDRLIARFDARPPGFWDEQLSRVGG